MLPRRNDPAGVAPTAGPPRVPSASMTNASPDPRPANRLAGDEPVPAPARAQPGRLVPWGPDAFARARQLDRPIFLSIGYSACHWCHVMEHESFEDVATADAAQRAFRRIKVDREERPDLDQIYMTAVQLMTGSGGWPMSVFLTPDRQAVLRRHLLSARGPPRPAVVPPRARKAWRGLADAARRSSRRRARRARRRARRSCSAWRRAPTARRDRAARAAGARSSLQRRSTRTYGGFGGAPKFPHPMDFASCSCGLEALRRRPAPCTHGHAHARRDGRRRHRTISSAAASIATAPTRRWLVPHFEKMLYDNALLAPGLRRSLPGNRRSASTARSSRRRSLTCSAR